jgi:hypothetical protein
VLISWKLPNKINLPAQDYKTVQQLYKGWAFAAVILVHKQAKKEKL